MMLGPYLRPFQSPTTTPHNLFFSVRQVIPESHAQNQSFPDYLRKTFTFLLLPKNTSLTGDSIQIHIILFMVI